VRKEAGLRWPVIVQGQENKVWIQTINRPRQETSHQTNRKNVQKLPPKTGNTNKN